MTEPTLNKPRSFAQHIVGAVLLLLLALLTLPLWLPFWAWISVRNWIDLERWYWECEEANRKRDTKAGAKEIPNA